MTDVMKGIRILEVAEHTFVPAASAILADWGADVIKVEHPERGDAMRGLGSTGTMSLGGDVHVLNEHSNRGKRSIGIDLSSSEGRAVLYRIVESCDVFLTNKLPGVLARLRIDVDDLRTHNPKLIYVRGTAFGPHGPDANRGGYDMTAFWCRAGNAASATPREIDGVLGQPGPAWGDSLGGMTIAGGIAAALLKRERTGEASVVDVSLLATGGWALSAAIALSLQTGQPWATALPSKMKIPNPLVGLHRTADGRYISLVMLQAAPYWADFCEHIDRPDLIDDPRFDSPEKLASNAEEARQIIGEVIAMQPLSYWSERLHTLEGQWAPVQNSLDFPKDPQVVANGYMARTATREGLEFDLVSTPVQFDEAPSPTRRAPEFNEHGDEILGEAGYDQDEILELRIQGAVT
jgi:crotonobetainyl-CoA:carnitine CoA-transferase CaiB-like acyl-CoA transferase